MSAINWTDRTWCFLADPQGLTLDGEPRRVAVGVDVDLFASKITNDEIDRAFAVMALHDKHTFQVLTKRPERMAEYLNDSSMERRDGRGLAISRLAKDEPLERAWPLPNVWLGTSVEDEEQADARVPHLLRCPAACALRSR